jgi:hypothetical protein
MTQFIPFCKNHRFQLTTGFVVLPHNEESVYKHTKNDFYCFTCMNIDNDIINKFVLYYNKTIIDDKKEILLNKDNLFIYQIKCRACSIETFNPYFLHASKYTTISNMCIKCQVKFNNYQNLTTCFKCYTTIMRQDAETKHSNKHKCSVSYCKSCYKIKTNKCLIS